MKTYLGLLAALLFTVDGLAQSQPIKTRDCFSGPFSSHQSWLELLSAKKKKFNQSRFLQKFPKQKFDDIKASIKCIDFLYKVDGNTVEGFYLAPKTSKNTPLPTIIFNRGGNAGFGKIKFGQKIDFLADLAKQGYFVIGSQLRGANKRIKNNGEDEFGGSDVNDVLALLPIIEQQPQADTSKIAMVGWSRGVMQSFLASQSMPQLKAIVGIAGVSDLYSRLEYRPEMERVYKARIPNYTENKINALAQRSVLKWLDKLPEAPILLVHGTDDKRVNVDNSIQLANALKKAKHEHELLLYPGDDHGLLLNRANLVQAINRWLQTHL